MTLFSKARDRGRGFLTRLARNKAGNTLALMAAAVIPLCGLVGGGVDMARIYMTKTRLQHACDAGALAGRKRMGGGIWTQDAGAPNASAMQFFSGNFATGSYGSYFPSGTVTGDVKYMENAGKVTGYASVVLPMTIMQVFGFKTDAIAVTCDAEMRLPNTDVMFVLDTTGSMADNVPGDTIPKIDGLKVAVKCFYEIVAKLDTDANCDGGNPSGGTGNQVQIRFGFVPYAVNVNVSNVLDGHSDWMVNNWAYQSRQYVASAGPGNPWSSWTTYTNRSTVKDRGGNVYIRCDSVPGNSGFAQYSITWNGGTYCQAQYRYKTVSWHYGLITQDISGLKSGSGFNSSVTAKIGSGGGNRSVGWDGCVEERKSDTALLTSEQDKIDAVPTDDTTRWAPVLPDMIFTRQTTTSINNGDTGGWNTADVASSTADYGNSAYYQCPQAAVKLQAWPDATAFDNYVDSLTPSGNTHHDIGLLWGARLVSPTGIFKAENAFTPKGGEIQRNVIFMTDGDTNSQPGDYDAYGVPWFDKRQISKNNPTDDDLNAVVNTRLLSICSAVKNMKNTTLWVISYGADVGASTQKNLQKCATDGRYFLANDSTKLQQTFRSIADQISQLRLTK